MVFIKLLIILLALSSSTVFAVQNTHQDVLKHLQLPDGFSISIFADNVPNARSLALGDNGVIFVASRQEGKVYALRDDNGDGVAEQNYIIASDLYIPNGVAYRDGSLYVAEVNRIIRFDAITAQLATPPKPKVVFDKFPSDRHHGWKYLRFGPDNKLYTAVGAPCNICKPEKDIYASLVRLNSDGSDFEIIGHGLRNSVGFDWQPGTNALFFTENGRDYLGEDVPPDELNQWAAVGDHFGFPYCHGGDIPDPEFGKDKKCTEFKPPVWKFGAHMAALGIRFYSGKQFPGEYKNQLLIAQHGSWNRAEPQGYRVVLIKFKEDHPIAEQVFITGWLGQDGKALGRPVDILELPDGSILISDDTLGVIYRVTYKGK